ncbi:MAG: hypothetical protein UGF89_05920 [Acutalibacteraceae bacterium]|nr:hypothetical protein [Acutalibacteraceae bacterium]
MEFDSTILKNEIEKLKVNSKTLVEEQEEFIEHLNNELDLGIDDTKTYDPLEILDEDIELPLSIAEDELLMFLKWRYSLILIVNQKSIIESLEAILSGDSKSIHRSVKKLKSDIKDIRYYRQIVNEIIATSNETLNNLNHLIDLCDKYRG